MSDFSTRYTDQQERIGHIGQRRDGEYLPTDYFGNSTGKGGTSAIGRADRRMAAMTELDRLDQ